VGTLPGTGTEFNNACVISNAETKEKKSYSHPNLYPKASVVDLDYTKTVSKDQWSHSVADAYMHVLEQFLCDQEAAPIQDWIAIGILKALVAFKAELCSGENINPQILMSFAWGTSLASSGILSRGVPADWSTHIIGHEITEILGVKHAATLTALFRSVYEVSKNSKAEKIKFYGAEIFGIRKDDAQIIPKALDSTKEFFRELGMPTSLSDIMSNPLEIGEEIKRRIRRANAFPLGEAGQITEQNFMKIFESGR
jgi:NADP-dependent alcohol dehydrogenase